MHASGTLYQPEHQIAFPEDSGAHFPAMIASEILLIYGGSVQCQFSRFFQQINIILSGFLHFGFRVLGDPRRVMLYVSWQYNFCPM